MSSHGVPVNNTKISIIKPVSKNKHNPGDSNIYRSIATSSVLGKVVTVSF